MFSTIFKEVTGYFSKRALILSLFPNMVFWALTLVAVLIPLRGWTESIAAWEKLGAVAKFILLITFFVWVTFWTFLTLNFQSSLIRLLEGYWSFDSLFNWRRRSHQKRWDELDRRDQQLEQQILACEIEMEEYEKLQYHVMTFSPECFDLVAADITTTQTMNKAAKALAAHLATLKADLKRLHSRPARWRAGPSGHSSQRIEQLIEIGNSAREKWLKFHPILEKGKESGNENCANRSQELAELIYELKQAVKSEIEEKDRERQRLNREQFLLYPAQRADVMPTRLGNVLKSIEMYPRDRYNIDAVIVWPRMLPALPKEFNEDLEASETSLGLMVIVSTFSLFFGLPLAVWLAIKSPAAVPWWVSAILLVIALLLRHRLPAALAVISLLLPLSASIIPYSGGLASQLQFMSALAAGILMASGLSYRNAIEASLAYGEKVKSAFDLYRWKVLEALHLELPTSFEKEKPIWEEVNRFLYRGDKPDAQYFVFAGQAKTDSTGPAQQATVRLPVLIKDHPAFSPINIGDLTEKVVREAHLPAGASRINREIIGKCPLRDLSAGEVIPGSCLVDPSRVAGTVAIGIPATPDMAIGGSLKAGDLVDILIKRDDGAPLTVFEDILVLDVRANADSHTNNDKTQTAPYVIVIALPANRRDSFGAMTYDGRLIVTRRITPGA